MPLTTTDEEFLRRLLNIVPSWCFRGVVLPLKPVMRAASEGPVMGHALGHIIVSEVKDHEVFEQEIQRIIRYPNLVEFA